MEIVPNEPRFYLVDLKDGGIIKIRATSYCDTGYGTFAFYKEDIDSVNKAYLKGSPLAPVYERSRKSIASVEEDGFIEIIEKPPTSLKLKKK